MLCSEACCRHHGKSQTSATENWISLSMNKPTSAEQTYMSEDAVALRFYSGQPHLKLAVFAANLLGIV
jgi:hypothetical protein